MKRSGGSRYGIGGLGVLAALCSCSGSGSGPGDPSEPVLPSLLFTTSAMAPIGGAYDGPAVVERSTAHELVLAFDPDPATGGTLPRHATIGYIDAALFPVGAKVWLRKNPVAAVLTPGLGLLAAPMSLSVLADQDGPLLLGVASGSYAASVTTPGLLPLQERQTTGRPYSNECASGTFETTTFDVQGDATVAIGDGDTRIARVGGVDYDVGLVARSFDYKQPTGQCFDAGPYAWFQLSVRARDLAALVSTLELGQAPACALGNAELEDVLVGLYNVITAPDISYDGPVLYARRGAREGFDCYDFDVFDVPGVAGSPPPTVEACVPPGTLAEPAVGTELWATISGYELDTLRKANRGDLIAASVVTSSSSVTSSRISEVLGMPVDVHAGCEYANTNQSAGGELVVYRLQEAAFGAPPAVVIGSQAHGVVSIGGVESDVWVWDSGALTILAR